MTKPDKPDRKQKPKREHDVHVRGIIHTSLSPEDEKRHSAERKEDTTTHTTERKEDSTRESHKLWLERGTLFAVVVYAGIAAWQGCLTRDLANISQKAFTATNKPSVGVNNFGCVHTGTDTKTNEIFHSPKRTPTTDNLDISAEIKNFGTVAAEDFTVEWTVFINGILQHSPGEGQSGPTIMYPGRSTFLVGKIGRIDYPGVMDGTKKLELKITVRYKGAGREYAYCEDDRYMPTPNSFGTIGSCPVTK